MSKKFGINGFGRIGRTTLRTWWQKYRQQAKLVAVNTSGSMEIEDWAHLLKYDTNYGIFKTKIEVERQQSKDKVTDENPILGVITLIDESDGSNQAITITAQRDPAKIPWNNLGAEIILESTGVFNTQEKASAHLTAGAKRVILSAPAKGGSVSASVLGINNSDTNNPIHSNASCTTNCVAPVAQIMVQKFGVEKAMLTTIHAYTDDQNTQDNSHQKDLRRARSAAENIIPTTTGAAKATTQIIPELEGLFNGLAIRVPTPVGSLSDMVFLTKKNTTVKEINQAFIDSSKEDRWQGILAVTKDPIVSSDIIGRSESSIVDLSLTQVVDGNLVKIISWYDNEWGYCCRLVEQIFK